MLDGYGFCDRRRASADATSKRVVRCVGVRATVVIGSMTSSAPSLRRHDLPVMLGPARLARRCVCMSVSRAQFSPRLRDMDIFRLLHLSATWLFSPQYRLHFIGTRRYVMELSALSFPRRGVHRCLPSKGLAHELWRLCTSFLRAPW